MKATTFASTLLRLAGVGLALCAAGCSAPLRSSGTEAFHIGLVADQHYDAESIAKYPNIMSAMDAADLSFVVHLGDVGTPTFGSCKDAWYADRFAEFDRSRHPFIFTPGDNDWTDCHEDGIPDSLAQLAKVRRTFFADERSLGQRKIAVTRQSSNPLFAAYRENARWMQAGVVFVTLHTVGSNNNLGRTPEMDREFEERNRANIDWLREAFAFSKSNGAKALMILTQANPQFDQGWTPRRKGSLAVATPAKPRPSGFTALVEALTREVTSFDKPVAFVHGDTHYFRVDKPLFVDPKFGANRGRGVEHFTRVEVFGYPEAHWVRGTIDPSSAEVFTFTPQMVRGNYADRWQK